jgi:hypothetical protein
MDLNIDVMGIGHETNLLLLFVHLIIIYVSVEGAGHLLLNYLSCINSCLKQPYSGCMDFHEILVVVA